MDSSNTNSPLRSIATASALGSPGKPSPETTQQRKVRLLWPTFTRWFDTAMRFIPTYYLSEALKLSMAGTASRQLWMNLAVLLGCTIVVFLVAVWALRRRG